MARSAPPRVGGAAERPPDDEPEAQAARAPVAAEPPAADAGEDVPMGEAAVPAEAPAEAPPSDADVEMVEVYYATDRAPDAFSAPQNSRALA